MENELVFGILTRDGVLVLLLVMLGIFGIIIVGFFYALGKSIDNDKNNTKLAKDAKSGK